MGRQERELLQKQAEIAKEGFLLKQQLINEAKRQQEEKQVNGQTVRGYRFIFHSQIVDIYITLYLHETTRTLCITLVHYRDCLVAIKMLRYQLLGTFVSFQHGLVPIQ